MLYNAGLQSDKTNLTRLVDYIETDEDMWVVTELAVGKKLPDLLVLREVRPGEGPRKTDLVVFRHDVKDGFYEYLKRHQHAAIATLVKRMAVAVNLLQLKSLVHYNIEPRNVILDLCKFNGKLTFHGLKVVAYRNSFSWTDDIVPS